MQVEGNYFYARTANLHDTTAQVGDFYLVSNERCVLILMFIVKIMKNAIGNCRQRKAFAKSSNGSGNMEQKYKVEQIFTKNYARLCAMATAILHDSSLAQDAVQEGWIRLHKAKQLDTSSEEKLEHLILITVRHAAYNIMRKGNPEPIEDSILNSIPDTSPSPHEIVESREVSRKIKNSLRNLSETDRSIIQLQYGQGYTSTQIAALLDISPNTVRQRAWRTRKMLKAVLEKEGIIL